MYKSCKDCPCYERKRYQTSNSYTEADWCFWYDGYCIPDQPCGNHFETRPGKNQEQMHDEVW